MSASGTSNFLKKLAMSWSGRISLLIGLLAAAGYYLGTSIELKLSLTDLLPDNHPAVQRFEKLTKVIGGVGYLTIILHAEDGKSHLNAAPAIVAELKKSPLVRNVFYEREQRFFVDRLLYFVELEKLKDLSDNIDSAIQKARFKAIDLGLWDDEPKDEQKPIFDPEIRDRAKRSAGISPYLMSKDSKDLLVMIKPSFDSMDLAKTQALIGLSESVLKAALPVSVGFKFAERYFSKVVETEMIQHDIFLLGTLSILLIAGIILAYLRSWRATLTIFIPVLMGMGITIGTTRLFIGHINIITGFLMGIVSGLGVDYGIHLVLRMRLEKKEPSSADPDPIWRTLASSGHSVFVGAVAAAVSFFLLTTSSFRAFSEFGFICGVGIIAVLGCLLGMFPWLCRWLKLEQHSPVPLAGGGTSKAQFPVLSLPKGLAVGGLATAVLIGLAFKVNFEYDFDKMLQHSEEMEARGRLVDDIYGRSVTPSGLSSPTREDAVAVEKLLKEKYIPKLVSEVISGATIVPPDQEEKQKVLAKIGHSIRNLKDRWIEETLEVSGQQVRGWVNAAPFTFADLPPHLQDALRGTEQQGFLLYVYPAIKLSDANSVNSYAAMVRDIERQFPEILSGSDAVIFSDILALINRDGAKILAMIFMSVGVFIWVNVRRMGDTLLSYIPLLISLPVGMGLMAICGVKFNIFNIAIIPTFVAMGIDVPIHIVHRAREIGSGFKAARDLAASINLALITAGVGFGVLVFAQAGVLRSLGWIALIGTAAIWWIGLFLLPSIMELIFARRESSTPNLKADSSALAQ